MLKESQDDTAAPFISKFTIVGNALIVDILKVILKSLIKTDFFRRVVFVIVYVEDEGFKQINTFYCKKAAVSSSRHSTCLNVNIV